MLLSVRLGLTSIDGPAAHILTTRVNLAWIILGGGVAGALLLR